MDAVSSPHIGTRSQITAANRRKGRKKQTETLRLQRTIAQQNVQVVAQETISKRVACFEAALEVLREGGYSLSEFCEWLFNPDTDKAQLRWAQFFKYANTVKQILDYWVSSKNSVSGRATVSDWAVSHVCALANMEARKVTESSRLQTARAGMNARFLLNYHPLKMYDYLSEKASVVMKVLESFATSSRQLANMKVPRANRKRKVWLPYVILLKIDSLGVHLE